MSKVKHIKYFQKEIKERGDLEMPVFAPGLPPGFFKDTRVAEGVRLMTDYGSVMAFASTATDMDLEALDNLVENIHELLKKHGAGDKPSKGYLAYRAYRKAMGI